MKRFGGATLCYRMLKDTLSCFTQLHFQMFPTRWAGSAVPVKPPLVFASRTRRESSSALPSTTGS